MPIGYRLDAPVGSNRPGLAIDLPGSSRADSDDLAGDRRKLQQGIVVPEESFLEALPRLVEGNHSGHREVDVRAAVRNPRPGRAIRVPLPEGAGVLEVERLDKNNLRVQLVEG
jgi:hypothetical protein